MTDCLYKYSLIAHIVCFTRGPVFLSRVSSIMFLLQYSKYITWTLCIIVKFLLPINSCAIPRNEVFMPTSYEKKGSSGTSKDGADESVRQ